ncbi:transcription elongation factor GreA [Mesorhizobium microcysteis]|uniref:Transcription elongation factor GreA n=1 Tax=Neoaquamicrobium microcysteis TaxID=2682781 RepID=A0A5D4H0C9_9HYPH|nr:transcription elongation factor GreA [Mesorhizobium microcysteis]TYR34326.1 transcription elongation factor GreA [Mesorhizobium microcysteis]
MSRAFTREEDSEAALADIGERPVSTHRNLVTPEGLAMIDAEVARLREELGRAEAEGVRERIALVARDLRYWTARRESAELSEPDPKDDVVRFGMRVTIVNDDEEERTWKIVGEDETDVSQGKISHVSPMAQALFGKKVGDVATVSGKNWEIVSIATR